MHFQKIYIFMVFYWTNTSQLKIFLKKEDFIIQHVRIILDLNIFIIFNGET